MTRQELAARAAAAWIVIRSRITLRRIVLGSAAVGTAFTVAVAGEAFLRAHIVSPLLRLPTAVYTRPTPWAPEGFEPAEGRPVAIGRLDGAPMEERVPLTLDDIPDKLVQAVLAVEDQKFFTHHGVDLHRIGGAFVANVRALDVVQGGSTITQQLAKNLFLSADRTPLRKVREAAMALMLELRYDKRTILEAYLNEIYLGQDGARAIRGVGAAAHYYFGKDIRRITLPEAAQLAAMISAPNRVAASRHPEAARERRDLVLQLMRQQQRIAPAVAERASRVEVTVGEHALGAIDGRFVRDYVVSQLDQKVPARGAAVYTTIDAALQRAAERAVSQALGRQRDRGLEAALVAIDPRTGDILAMVGGREYGASQFNRATDAHRQPGSAFKPIVALAALAPREHSSPAFTLASVVDDEPFSVDTPQGPWTPVDYDRNYRGPVSVREAMEQSLNIPFARIGLATGPDRIVGLAQRLGITSKLTAVPSIALGSSEVSLLELTRAYGVLADSGRLARTRTISGIVRGTAGVEIDSTISDAQVVDPAVAYLVTSMLQGVTSRGTARALNEDDHLGAIAGKTGTSNDWRDAWFIGYSSSLVVGVWVGHDNGESIRMTGATAALPIVANFLNQVSPSGGWPAFTVPEGITEAYVSARGEYDGDCGTREYFLAGTEPNGNDCGSFHLPGIRSWEQLGAVIEQRAREWLKRLVRRR